MPPIVIGCDLSRAWLDIHALPGGPQARIENTRSGIAGRLAGIDPAALVVFEATSGCDGPLIAALAGRGIAFARVNPRQARDFARATGILAKTDRARARVLAEMGSRLPLEPTPPARCRQGPARGPPPAPPAAARDREGREGPAPRRRAAGVPRATSRA